MSMPADKRSSLPPPPAGRPLRLTQPVQAMAAAIPQVVVVWRGRIIGYRLLVRRARVTIGPHHGATFLAPLTDGRRKYVLLKPARGGYTLRLAPALRGEVQSAGNTSEVEDYLNQPVDLNRRRNRGDVREVTLAPGDRAKLYFAESPDLRIEIRWVDPPEVLARPKVEDPMMFQTLVGTSLVIGLAAALLLFLYRPPEKPLAITAERIAKIEEPVLEIEKKVSARHAAEKAEKKKQEEGQMKKAKEKAGKLGKQDATQKDTVIPKGDKDVLREKVQKVGILSIIGNQKQAGSGLSKLFAEDSAVEQAVAGMAGAKMVAGRGNGGLSTSGAGPGGGGTGYGHIYGAGNLDTGGRGTHGKGRGPKLADRGEKEVSVGMGGGAGDADGSLSKEQINKVVRAHLAGVKYCYEKELQHKSGLSGGVDIFWVIQPDGTVSKASVKSTTLGDTATEGCILRQVKQWQFPKAPGQTIVGRYPFIFKGGT
ncbi:MAG TPA: AgmX/PglI C-terminal domain-containing protein [Polyangia bacterium]|nr:AgmX/PglI C-terminal domain-containing protein [Polyangia bacterium]